MASDTAKPFFQQVYDLVANIPAGYVATYGQIAALCGRPHSAKIVGFAMHSAPAERHLPCHRVVNRFGQMAPHDVFGSRDLQQTLLAEEGITFLANGCIDLAKHLWPGPV